jgi:hypothetical protein
MRIASVTLTAQSGMAATRLRAVAGMTVYVQDPDPAMRDGARTP